MPIRLRGFSRWIARVWLVAVIAASVPAYAWFDCTWPYRSEVTITETSGSALTDYQVLLELTGASFSSDYIWSNAGQDLRVLDQDDVTELQFFIEAWDSVMQTARVWVQLDTLAASSARTIYLYVGNTAAAATSTALTFTEPGIKFNTRFTTANPTDKALGFAALDAAPLVTAGYGCTFITDFTGVTNRSEFSPPSQNGDFVAYSESFFEVASGEAGDWSFRYGGDFGRGGALYINDVALEESWNDDLWWAFDWSAAAEVLEGTITLTEGYHKLEVIGFEGCCDGGITVQFRKPGGVYQTFQTSVIDVVSRQCPVAAPGIVFVGEASQLPNVQVVITPEVLDDPINALSNPKALPGSHSQLNVLVSNLGGGAPEPDSLTFRNTLPDNSFLYLPATPFTFVDGPVPSGLIFNFDSLASTTDSVEFSTDGIDFSYVPTPDAFGVDINVTDLRISPTGTMGCSTGAGDPSFEFGYQILVP